MKPILLLAGMFACFPVYAHPYHRQNAVHVHGEAGLQVAVHGEALAVSLRAPGHGLLDFERPPRNAAERARLDAALDALRRADWLQPAKHAGCRLDSATVQAHGFDGHDDHDHRHQEHHHEHAHAGFDADYRLHCTQPAALDHLMVALAARFPGLRRIVVEIATHSGQGRTELDARRQRIDLPR